jgi:hypothetical protein
MGSVLPLQVASLADLREREADILDRLRQVPNGERLFLVHPLRALADVGVVLEDTATAELLRVHPTLSFLSDTPYDALRGSPALQPGTVRLAGLFRWEQP